MQVPSSTNEVGSHFGRIFLGSKMGFDFGFIGEGGREGGRQGRRRNGSAGKRSPLLVRGWNARNSSESRCTHVPTVKPKRDKNLSDIAICIGHAASAEWKKKVMTGPAPPPSPLTPNVVSIKTFPNDSREGRGARSKTKPSTNLGRRTQRTHWAGASLSPSPWMATFPCKCCAQQPSRVAIIAWLWFARPTDRPTDRLRVCPPAAAAETDDRRNEKRGRRRGKMLMATAAAAAIKNYISGGRMGGGILRPGRGGFATSLLLPPPFQSPPPLSSPPDLSRGGRERYCRFRQSFV